MRVTLFFGSLAKLAEDRDRPTQSQRSSWRGKRRLWSTVVSSWSHLDVITCVDRLFLKDSFEFLCVKDRVDHGFYTKSRVKRYALTLARRILGRASPAVLGAGELFLLTKKVTAVVF